MAAQLKCDIISHHIFP